MPDGSDKFVFNSASDLRERGYSLRDPPLVGVAYDPAGDGNDRDALVMIAREEWRRGELYDPDLAVEFVFRALLALRMPPDLEFPDKIAKVLSLHRMLVQWQRRGKIWGHLFTVETNGVGYGVAAALQQKLSSTIIPYVTVGNTSNVPEQGKKIAMPRLAALDHMRMLVELQRFKAASSAPGIEMLVQEMNSFIWRRAGRPEAMDGEKDDLVMGTAGALWILSKVVPPITRQQKFPRGQARGTPSSATRMH